MKKLLTVILAIALAAASTINAAASAVPAPNENGAVSVETASYSERAWGALAPYIYSGTGEILRDDFAGVWVEPGNEDYCYIALTPDADTDFYRNILKEYDNYELVTLNYSLKTLRHMRDVVFDRCKEIMSGAGVSEDENVIKFEVRVLEGEENGRIAAAMKAIKEEENLPDGIENAFEITYGVCVIPVDDEVQVPAEGKVCKDE